MEVLMPIYEYLCGKCNVIYSFFIRSIGGASSPHCPKCGNTDLKRVLSSFSTGRKGSNSQSADSPGDGMPDLSGIDENDPRSVARAIRSMADEMGEDLGPELSEAIGRLEAGEDPEKIERDMDEAGFGGEGGPEPSHDGGLYEG
jgi:putative FmdB family regulatory protein